MKLVVLGIIGVLISGYCIADPRKEVSTYLYLTVMRVEYADMSIPEELIDPLEQVFLVCSGCSVTERTLVKGNAIYTLHSGGGVTITYK